MKKSAKISTVSVLGCGWLGSPLARRLLSEGFTVKGSTTRTEKLSVMKGVGIMPYLLRLDPELQSSADDFFETDLLIIDIPPRTHDKGDHFHPEQIRAIAEEIKKYSIRHCIYISSTSVYPNLEREVKEEDAGTLDSKAEEEGGNKALLEGEEILKSLPNLQLSILRCGGLMGYDRVPGRYFAGKKELRTGKVPVNYIHRDDVIGIILQLIQKQYWNETINAVAPLHPNRQEVYEQTARELGFEPPTFAGAEAKDYKVVNAEKLQKDLGYEFIYPNPIQFPYSRS